MVKYEKPQRNEKIWDIRERSFAFAVRIVKLCRSLEQSGRVSRTLITQLLKAGTSIGANLEEAQGGQTKPDFITKNSISLKEARESRYWLRVIAASCDLAESEQVEVRELTIECQEIALIVGAILVSARK